LALKEVFFSGSEQAGDWTPTRRKGTTKYGQEGQCSRDSLGGGGLDEETRDRLAKLANMGLSQKTWSSYKTAEKMLAMCSKQCDKPIELPISKDDTLRFIDWLFNVRQVKATTVHSYLAGIRQLHIVKGIDPPEIRTELVKLVLRGKENKDAIEKRTMKKPTRLPITDKVLRLLKECIRQWREPLETKLLVWAVSAIAFAGSFRTGELLCRKETVFDPDFDLLTEDIQLTGGGDPGTEKLIVKLKCPKESKKGNDVLVDIFQTDNDICPVRAYKKWQAVAKVKTGQPAFRHWDGRPLTSRKLNKILRELLRPHFSSKYGKFTTHSFRAGVPSMLAARGADEKEIKASGRWTSTAVQAYIKKPRTTRIAVAKKIARL